MKYIQNRERNYILLALLHIAIGILVFYIPFFAKIYSLLIVLIGVFFVVKNKNENQEVLIASAYLVGSEVFLRMTDGNPSYEFAKYGVIFFILLGMLYHGFSRNAVPYWIYMLLLIPGVFIATSTLNLTSNIRTTIAFNISGPFCLGLSSLYTFNKNVSIQKINQILLFMGLPIISCALYLFFYTPDLKEVLTGTSSNDDLSGHFGPNQVSTMMGLGMFVFFSRILLESKSKIILAFNLIFAFYISYRGMLTFSRGGMITGFIMILGLVFFIYFNSKYNGKVKLNYLMVLLFVVMSSIWLYTSYQTNGLIDKRYANKDALGRVKKDQLTGRGELASGELDMFLENPVFGVGVAKGTEIRSEQIGNLTASHDEITRTLAEHGTLGIIALLILFCTPIFLYLDNKQHIYLFSFFIFWLLTINHAAMRTAAPAFVYALALLKVKAQESK